MPVYMKKKTYVSVQTSTNVTWNPLAISMVTTKPTVQKLCETDSQRESERQKVLYRYKTRGKKKEKGKQR